MDVVQFEKASKVNAIYWVDDEHASEQEIDLDVLATALTSLVETNDDDINKKLKGALEEMHPDLKIQIRSFFKDTSKIENLVSNLDEPRPFLEYAVGHYEGIPKEQLINTVDSYLSGSPNYLKISFTEWNKRKDEILSTLNSENKLLIFLDLKNTKEASIGSDAGIDIITNLSAHQNKDNALIVLFTSSVDPDKEIQHSREFTNTHYDSSSLPIFMLSKRRNAADANIFFADILKRVLLTVSYDELKSTLSTLFAQSVTQTFSELRTMTAEEMVYKLARGSEKEGISIVESLFRVIGGVTRSNFQNSVSTDPATSAIVNKCLGLDAQIERCENIEDKFLSDFLYNELYENIVAINKMHSPACVGDVFRITAGDTVQEYILIGNFCFTSLRKEGDRKSKRATLFPVIAAAPSHKNCYELKMFKKAEGNDSRHFIDFTNPICVDFFYLDMCWTTPDGQPDLTIGADELEAKTADLPLVKAQRNRLTALKEAINSKLSNENVCEIYRVARLTQEHALLAVHEYCKQLSLIPEEIDFN